MAVGRGWGGQSPLCTSLLRGSCCQGRRPMWPEPPGSQAATAVTGSREGLCRRGPGDHLPLGRRPNAESPELSGWGYL